MALPQVSKIKELLKDYNQEDVKIFASYIQELLDEKDKDSGKMKNGHMAFKTEDFIANCFMKVNQQWLTFDWKHITLQSTWISYDYVAYKNKMIQLYPETKIDIALIYKWDDFSFSKESGKVIYSHKINNPFDRKDDLIQGWYVVIKNSRGEFLTLLSKADIEKHKASSKMQNVWKNWYPEMCMKTLMKKWCATHFKDEFTSIEEQDNENFDVDVVQPEVRNYIEEINKIDTLTDLVAYHKANEGKWKELVAHLTRRKNEIIAQKAKDAEELPE